MKRVLTKGSYFVDGMLGKEFQILIRDVSLSKVAQVIWPGGQNLLNFKSDHHVLKTIRLSQSLAFHLLLFLFYSLSRFWLKIKNFDLNNLIFYITLCYTSSGSYIELNVNVSGRSNSAAAHQV